MREVPIIEKSDSRIGIIASIVYALIVLFLLFFLTVSRADPPKKMKPLPIKMGSIGITDFQIDNGGGGAPSKVTSPHPEPKENPKEQATQEESPVVVPKGTGESESQGKVSEEPAAPNPFSGNGSGGSGTSGSGNGFGSDNGPGGGSGAPGLGGGGDRELLTHKISKPQTTNNESGFVTFRLTVDSRGHVLRADIVRSKTSIDNQAVLDELTEIVKKEVRYNSQPGAKNVKITYRVAVTAN